MASLEKVLLVLVLALLNYHCNCEQTCKYRWKDFTDAVTRGTKDDFIRYIEPLAQMSQKAYTGEVQKEIAGWELVQEFKLSHGLYAVAYQCVSDRSKIVVAFRGLRFGLKHMEGMRNDFCARFTLQSAGDECSDDKTPLPHICNGFQGWHLDYLNQARIFVAQLRAVFKQECFLYTGHSLGSSLAALMSAGSRGKSLAIGFSSNPSNLAEIVPYLDIPEADFSNVITIYHKHDHNAAEDSAQVGVKCIFEDQPEPEACATCYAKVPLPDFSSALLPISEPCGKCLYETQSFSHLLEYINGPEESHRPLCYEQGGVEIPNAELPSISEEDIERRLLNLLNKLLE